MLIAIYKHPAIPPDHMLHALFINPSGRSMQLTDINLQGCDKDGCCSEMTDGAA